MLQDGSVRGIEICVFCVMHFKTADLLKDLYSDTSADEDNSFRNHIR